MKRRVTTTGIGTGIQVMVIPAIPVHTNSILPVGALIKTTIRKVYILPEDYMVLGRMSVHRMNEHPEKWYMGMWRPTGMIRHPRKLLIPNQVLNS